MTLQVRVTDPDGSNPIILDTAKTRTVSFAIGSEDEGGKFSIAKNHPKADVLNPDTTGYTKFWEIWDTQTNARLNFGPITSITEKGTDWVVEGKGRSALLNDFIDTRKTFYATIDGFVESLRFENIAIEPKSSTLVHSSEADADQTTVFGAVTIDEKYNGISLNTKDNIIDNQINLRPGEVEPPNSFYTTPSFWSGMSRSDAIIVDLGEVYPISRLNVSLPTWGGLSRYYNRAYDFTLAYADDVESTITTWKNRKFGPFHTLYSTGTDTKKQSPFYFNLGTTYSGGSLGASYVNNVALNQAGPVDMRYIRVNISNTTAWFGDNWSGVAETENWAKQCSPNYGGGISENIEIDDRTQKPNNDCFASALEISAFKEIISRDVVKPLALQRIDNNNMQITYFHSPDASETTSTDNGFRLFEPGGLFRKITFNYSGASTSHTKFFSSDCTNCYPDGFNFGVSDQNNTLIYASDSSSGSGVSVKGPVYTRKVLMKGSSNAVITSVDSWSAKSDALSWGSSYSFSEVANDYAILHFRGQSFKWYATIPANKTGATVKIERRNKNSSGVWTSWTTLENSYVLSNNISAELVYEITYESGSLLAETVYEIRITNLDGNYASIDSFEGYWSASMSSYNDDSSRMYHSKPDKMTQIYDGRFTNGTMTKWNGSNVFTSFGFEGDRFVVLSAKGRHHGKLSIFLLDYSERQLERGFSGSFVSIPGGTLPNGGIQIDLATGKRGAEIPQFIAFDSNEIFTSGLPWGRYGVVVVLRDEDLDSYTANIYDTNNFVARCEDCKTPKGTQTINKYIYFDSATVHEKLGISVSFDTQTHLEMVKSVAEAIQVEWEVNERGLRFEPRIGTDTNIILREGQNTVVDYEIVNDASKIASMLFSNGADIDGLPLTTIVEDRKNRNTLGRTVMKTHDFRSNSNYQQLIGMGRMELRKRRVPEKRIIVTHIASDLDLIQGDSYILYTKKQGPLRVRIEHLDINEDSGREYRLECIRWPIISR